MRSRNRVLVIVAVVVVAAGLGATAALALTTSGPHAYRTATVTRGSVTQQLHGAGTIEPVSQATVAFPVAGTVASVNVQLGQQVQAGTKLAALNTSALESTVTSKQAALATAQLNLSKALNGEPVSGAGGRSGSGASGTTTPTTNAVTTAVRTTTGTAPNGATGRRSGASSAQAVVAAQHAVDLAMDSVDSALAAANSACAAPSSSSPAGRGSPPISTVPGSTTTTTPASATTGYGTAACATAQQRLLQSQQQLARKQQALAQAENAYERALQSLPQNDNAGSRTPAGAPGGSNPANRSSANTGNRSSADTGNRSSAGGVGSTSVTYSAQQLVAYQAAVDAASADVAAAQENVAQAVVTSPITGTVVALSLHSGEQVSADSSTANVVIAGGGGYEVATTISVNDITKVKVGDAASLVPDGSLQTINGQVVFIGSPSTTQTSTTYPVVIGLTGSPNGLRNGAMATTTIDTGTSAASALLVPTSAVHNLNGRYTVTVLSSGKTSTVPVQIGVVGAQQTAITSGLQAGQTVVLADLHAAVPSSSADSRIASQFGSGLTGGGANRGARGGG